MISKACSVWTETPERKREFCMMKKILLPTHGGVFFTNLLSFFRVTFHFFFAHEAQCRKRWKETKRLQHYAITRMKQKAVKRTRDFKKKKNLAVTKLWLGRLWVEERAVKVKVSKSLSWIPWRCCGGLKFCSGLFIFKLFADKEICLSEFEILLRFNGQ